MKPITVADARSVLAHVHGLDDSTPRLGKAGTLSVFQKLQCVQSDPIEVAGRNADLALQSRVNGYEHRHLTELLYEDRRLFEYFCKMHSIMPLELYPIFKNNMTSFAEEKQIKSFFKKYGKETRIILRALDKGPISSRDIAGMRSLKWGWGRNTNLANIILTRLWVSGKTMISHRDGALKYYALSDEVLPEKLLNAAPYEAGEDLLEIASIIVKASRIVTPGRSPEQWYEVGGTDEVKRILSELEQRGRLAAVQLDGSSEKFYVPTEDAEEWVSPKPPKEDYVRILAPLDSLLWSRRVFRLIYGREYVWEVYKKPKDRRYGYYCLPLLFNGDYVALMQPFFRKDDKTLEIRSFHILESEISKERFLHALNQELKRFCGYLGAAETEAKRCPSWAVRALRIPG